ARSNRTSVYVDGFNLYYGALRGTPYRWLDIPALCRTIFPHNHIDRIRYFTALASSRPNDPNVTVRQQTYLRALATCPEVSIHYGHFLQSNVTMPSVTPPPRYVNVIKTEEKGSDVNLASHLLMDCFRGDFDVAIVISNDSDLITPLRMVRDMGRPVGLLNPHRMPARKLKEVATFYRPIRESALKASQFPVTLKDAHGAITRPKGW
ncbi:MAG: NYN domain-containing protein, partial [Dehalococcoidia bacterium]